MSRAIEQRRGPSWSGLGRAGRFVWDAIWLPFWLGSTMPPPSVPGPREQAVVGGERTPQILQQLDGLRATIWQQRRSILLFRSAWLALAVLNVWLGLRVIVHRQPTLLPFLIGALVLLAGGGLLIATARPSRGQLARTLDRSFGLRERVATAYETAEGERRFGGVRALQVLEATRVARQVGAATAFQSRRPVREIVLTGAMALLAAVLLVLLFLGRDDAPGGAGTQPGQGPGQSSAAGNQPQTNQGSQPGTQPGNEPNNQGAQGTEPGSQPGNQPTAQGQRDLDTLGGALADHGATREAADQIANGNNAGAAQALREAGQGASSQSPQARQELAEDLREAAGQVSDPQLAEDLREAANALEQPNAAGAQEAFDDLAEDVERLGEGQSPTGQGGDQGGDQGQGDTPGGAGGSGNNSGGQGGTAPQLPSSQRTQPSTGQPTDPLGTNGQPVQLPKGSGSNATVNTQNQGGTSTGPAGQGAAAAGGGQLRQGDVGDSGIDPNQVPYDQRGTVQQYFTPQEPEE